MRYLLVWCLLGVTSIVAGEISEARLGFDGYVRQVNFWDSRQVIAERSGDYSLFPQEKNPDVQGRDINAQGDFGMWAIDTTLTLTVGNMHLGGPRGPDVLGKVAFFFLGNFEDFIELATQSFGFFMLQWENTNLLVGQTTNPPFFYQISPNKYLDTLDVVAPAFQSSLPKQIYDDPIPRTVSYAFGLPIETFAYVPMVRLMHTFCDTWHMLLAAQAEQSDSSSVGFVNTTPEPFVLPPTQISSEYWSNSKIPVLNAQLHKYFSNQSAIIVGAQYRRIQPSLVTDLNYKADTYVDAWSAYAGVKLNWHPVLTVIKCLYTQNGEADGNLCTYGIRTINPNTHEFTYTPLQTLNLWMDMRPAQDHHRYSPGIFVGYRKNLGTTHPLVNINEVSPAWGFTSYKDVIMKGNLIPDNQDLNIDWMIKIIPRIFIAFKRFQIGAEIEYNYVRFGDVQQNGRVTNTYPVNHFRFLTGFYYYF